MLEVWTTMHYEAVRQRRCIMARRKQRSKRRLAALGGLTVLSGSLAAAFARRRKKSGRGKTSGESQLGEA